jgi:mycothiol synthase
MIEQNSLMMWFLAMGHSNSRIRHVMIVAKNKHLEAATALLGGKKHRAQSLLQTLSIRPSDAYRFIAQQDDTIEAAVLVVMNKGATATILATEPTSGVHVNTVHSLIEESIEGLKGSGCSIAQAVLPVDAEPFARAYSKAGFECLATLKYMERKRSSKLNVNHKCEAKFIPMTNQPDATLGSILLDTYEGSLDCPRIHGLRNIADIIQGHRGMAHYDPSLWSLAEVHGNIVGSLLLNAVPESNCMELAYLGVAPAARGSGLGDAFVQRAIEQSNRRGFSKITLAVDGDNLPAINLYSRWGFGETGRRLTMICKLC